MSIEIDTVTTFIEDHLPKIAQPKDVAEVVSVSYATLRKRFRREVGVPLGCYIRQRRIEQAKQKLAATTCRAI